jgi:hypothetical protein
MLIGCKNQHQNTYMRSQNSYMLDILIVPQQYTNI